MVLEIGLVEYDNETEELLVLGWLKHNPPMNPKHETGNTSKMERVRSERLLEKLMETWVRHIPKEPENNGVPKLPISSQLRATRLVSGNSR